MKKVFVWMGITLGLLSAVLILRERGVDHELNRAVAGGLIGFYAMALLIIYHAPIYPPRLWCYYHKSFVIVMLCTQAINHIPDRYLGLGCAFFNIVFVTAVWVIEKLLREWMPATLERTNHEYPA